jgi:Na+:H+ antiporter, NhaA family
MPSADDPERLSAYELLATPWSRSDRLVPRTLVQPALRFMRTEVASGIWLVIAAVIALAWANSPLEPFYHRLWATELAVRIGPLDLAMALHEWVNDLAMALFFFLIGLEIKRERVHGDLQDLRVAVLPVAAAIGGMIVPAAIYLAINQDGPTAAGWGVPMATDIAFALAVLTLMSRRVPMSLKVFLLTLAIVDDIGAILVIAVVYSSQLAFGWLAAAVVTFGAVVVCRRLHIRSLVPYTVLAGLAWLFLLASGVHATIAGVVLGLLTPARPFHRPDVVATVLSHPLADLADRHAERDLDEERMLEVSRLADEGVSPLARLEARLQPWTAFAILPIFALANAGVTIDRAALVDAAGSPVVWGVVAGLVLGKPLGIVATCAALVATGRATLPRGCGWSEIVGVGLLAGIGFTVAMFVSELAFTDPALTAASKLGIIAASVIAAGAGTLVLALRRPNDAPAVTEPTADAASLPLGSG